MTDIIATVEMTKGTRFKYEYDKKTGELVLDRPLTEEVPHNYGFIYDTVAPDGDALDVFIGALEHIPTYVEVKLEAVGVIRCLDNGVQDDKILAYVKDDSLGQRLLPFREFSESCKLFLQVYKPGFEVLEIVEDKELALKLISESRDALVKSYSIGKEG